MTEVKAKLNYLRVAPRKARLVADLIRGRAAKEALIQLKFSQKRGASPLLKLLKSAVQNARHNFNLSIDNLYVKEIRVDQGPAHKRWMPRAFGRASMIRKKTSHITLILNDKSNKLQAKKPKAKIL